jgi:uncharacterized membrane protein YqgA involved in biofilm formation
MQCIKVLKRPFTLQSQVKKCLESNNGTHFLISSQDLNPNTMNPILRNVLAVVAGLVLGSVVNMALINLGPSIIPPPEGGDISTMEGLKETMHLFEPRHFLFPWLAHAIGTLVGAAIAARLAAKHHLLMGMVVGLFFLAGGIYMAVAVPAPLWFIVADLALAYQPMAYLGAKLATRKD